MPPPPLHPPELDRGPRLCCLTHPFHPWSRQEPSPGRVKRRPPRAGGRKKMSLPERRHRHARLVGHRIPRPRPSHPGAQAPGPLLSSEERSTSSSSAAASAGPSSRRAHQVSPRKLPFRTFCPQRPGAGRPARSPWPWEFKAEWLIRGQAWAGGLRSREWRELPGEGEIGRGARCAHKCASPFVNARGRTSCVRGPQEVEGRESAQSKVQKLPNV